MSDVPLGILGGHGDDRHGLFLRDKPEAVLRALFVLEVLLSSNVASRTLR